MTDSSSESPGGLCLPQTGPGPQSEPTIPCGYLCPLSAGTRPRWGQIEEGACWPTPSHGVAPRGGSHRARSQQHAEPSWALGGHQRAEDPSADLGTVQPQGRLRVSCPQSGTKPWGPRLVLTRPPAQPSLVQNSSSHPAEQALGHSCREVGPPSPRGGSDPLAICSRSPCGCVPSRVHLAAKLVSSCSCPITSASLGHHSRGSVTRGQAE